MTEPFRESFRAPADPAAIGRVHELFERLGEQRDDLSERFRGGFELAVVEVVTNVVRHSEDGAAGGGARGPRAARARRGGGVDAARGRLKQPGQQVRAAAGEPRDSDADGPADQGAAGDGAARLLVVHPRRRPLTTPGRWAGRRCSRRR